MEFEQWEKLIEAVVRISESLQDVANDLAGIRDEIESGRFDTTTTPRTIEP